MIAVSSKGRSFRALAAYLATGRTGREHDRVAWSSARNLPTNEPELAGKIMRATAEQNVRVERPVYHLVLSFDPNDRVDRATMERVADRVLSQIGLQDHQAVIVAHRDREHAHVHVLVNRVHPVTGHVWDLSYDFRAIQQVLRREERALGIREVPGRYQATMEQGIDRVQERHAGDDGRAPSPSLRRPEGPQNGSRSDAPNAAIGPSHGSPRQDAADRSRRGQRTKEPDGNAAFLRRVREHVPAFRASVAWSDLEAALAYHGLRMERKGQGLVVTDGTHHARMSRVAPDLGKHRLETRFGLSYDAFVERWDDVVERSGKRIETARVQEALAHTIDGPGAATRDVEGQGRAQTARPLKTRIDRRASERRDIDSEGVHAAGATAPRDIKHDTGRGTGRNVPGDRVANLARKIETYEHVAATFGEYYAATHALRAARARLALLEAAEARARATGERFDRGLESVYRDPRGARTAFDRCAIDTGIESASRAMRERPEQFGSLITNEHRRAFGFLRGEDDTSARQAAPGVATLGREAWHARAGIHASEELAAARDGVSSAIERELGARVPPGRGRLKRRLEHGIGQGMRALVPRQVEDLRRLLTAPRCAIAMKLKQLARQVVLEQDDRVR
jgi:hypothetical protein